MSSSQDSAPPGELVARADPRILMSMTWGGYEALMKARGDVAGPRIAFLDGVVELMSPSRDHERIKS
jgi:hypothetical protein